MKTIAIAGLAACLMAAGGRAQSQGTAVADFVTPLVLVTGEPQDRIRLAELSDSSLLPSILLRSPSSQTPSGLRGRSFAVRAVAPELLLVRNSEIPFSINNGSLWAGRGTSVRALAGIDIETRFARIIIAPELVASQNQFWVLRPPEYSAPPVPPERSGGGFVFPYYIRPYSIDLPLRHGDEPIRRITPGQTSATLRVGKVAAGASSENEWWGPGVRNALLMSGNAEGFPHLFIRTNGPVRTPLGALEVRWLVGGLTESSYFDTDPTNNLRSISAFAATLRTGWTPNLSIGLARSVFATSTGWSQIPLRWLDVFAATGHPSYRALQDSSLTPGGRDQLLSFFGRWTFPREGFEVYGELARMEFPASVREIFVAPNHTQGYTLGLQGLRGAGRGGRIRLQTEVTNVEQGATFRDQPVGSFYTSRRVIQGYTNRGQGLGASIGPGASSQWLAFDYLRNSGRIGAYLARIRWNEDVHGTAGFPVNVNYCNHDVSMIPGVRAAVNGAIGFATVDMAFGNRINAFFQNASTCFLGSPVRDIRNTTFTVTLGSFARLPRFGN